MLSLLRGLVQWRTWLCRLLRRWLGGPRRFSWPSHRTGEPMRRTHAPPKPEWVRREIIRLKALMPDAGCRTITHNFNRRFAERRHMTVGKTYVADTVS